jgi:tyrosyl-tRNA synthetase
MNGKNANSDEGSDHRQPFLSSGNLRRMSATDLRRATPDEQFIEVTRGHVDLHTADELRARLKESYDSGVPLRIKAGFDPTSPDLHLGHTLVIQRMRRFQEFGHVPVFIIGDTTGMIGDPTGRNAARPPMTFEAIRANAETYKKQVFKILDPDHTEVRYNSEWLGPMDFIAVVRLAARYTVTRMLERTDFRQRFRAEQPIHLHEMLYPLAQGWDSVMIKADVELGGSDQLFNLLVGRQLMKEENQRPQVVLTGPILEGTDARFENGAIVGDKMSKSLGNFVGITEDPKTQYDKLMQIRDEVAWRYLELLSALSLKEIEALKTQVASGAMNAREVKDRFAREIVTRFHGAEAAAGIGESKAIEVTLGGAPELILSKVLVLAGLAKSGNDAQRVIQQGGVTLDGAAVGDWRHPVKPGRYTLTYGKRVRANLDVKP